MNKILKDILKVGIVIFIFNKIMNLLSNKFTFIVIAFITIVFILPRCNIQQEYNQTNIIRHDNMQNLQAQTQMELQAQNNREQRQAELKMQQQSALLLQKQLLIQAQNNREQRQAELQAIIIQQQPELLRIQEERRQRLQAQREQKQAELQAQREQRLQREQAQKEQSMYEKAIKAGHDACKREGEDCTNLGRASEYNSFVDYPTYQMAYREVITKYGYNY